MGADFELDHLSNSMPEQASGALYEETSMDGAWGVLDKLFGYLNLMANKLKLQLKSIKPKGKGDQDVVIDLANKVNNIVLRLKCLNLNSVLAAKGKGQRSS